MSTIKKDIIPANKCDPKTHSKNRLHTICFYCANLIG